jgi:anti-sigma B factor antagonist
MLKVHIRKLGTAAVISLQGQIVNGETETLRNAVQSLSGVRTVIIDLARVSIVDAKGFGVMLELRAQAETEGIRFELMNVPKQVGMLLELTRLDSVFRITSRVRFLRSRSRSSRRRASALRLASCA